MKDSELICSHGFTLIEVVVGLCVFTIGVLAVLSMLTTAVNSGARSSRQTIAACMASDVAEWLMVKPYDCSELAPGGHELNKTGDKTFLLRYVVEEKKVLKKKTVKVISVFVEWQGAGRNHSKSNKSEYVLKTVRGKEPHLL